MENISVFFNIIPRRSILANFVGANRNSKFMKQDHLRMNEVPDLNNHLWSIDLFRSMIIKKNRSKVRDSH